MLKFLASVPQLVENITLKGLIGKAFKDNTDNVFIQLFRYTFVGGVAFIVDFLLLFVFTEYFKVYYLTSATISFICGLGTNYILSVSWVFNNRSVQNRLVEFVVFGFIGIVGAGGNILFIWFFTEITHFHYLVSKIVSTVLVYFWNFTVRKFFLFR
jgi:putative flippase GtrA